MKLLVTTQAVDTGDPTLGFFHGWLREFAMHVEQIHVVCLCAGTFSLPPNVLVHSLGKETGANRLKYIWNTLRYAWTLRKEYDVVFSHMNPHYLVLCGWLWWLFRKRMYFWRNHAKMNAMTWIAGQFSTRVFYTSPFACTSRFSHALQMPVGIDTTLFRPDPAVVRKEGSVLLFGRLSPVKRAEVFMEAAKMLSQYEFHSYGNDPSVDGAYKRTLETIAQGTVQFHPAIPHHEASKVYSAFDIYVNLTPEGSMDKTVLEAAACGTLVLAVNRSYEDVLPKECMLKDATPQCVAEGIIRLASLPPSRKVAHRDALREMVQKTHSLSILAKTLMNVMHEGSR